MPCVGIARWNFQTKKIELLKWEDVFNNYSYPIAAAMQRQTEGREGYHVTHLTWCIRQSYFQKIYDYYMSIDSVLTMWDGTSIHKALEEEAKRMPANTGATEVNFEEPFEINGQKIVLTGRADYLEKLADGTYSLEDYKRNRGSAVFQVNNKVFSSHEQQLNMYRYGLRNKYQISQIRVHLICNYHGMITKNVTLWTYENTRQFIERELGILVGCESGKIPTVTECRRKLGMGDRMCIGWEPKCPKCGQIKPEKHFPPIPCPFWISICQEELIKEQENKKGDSNGL